MIKESFRGDLVYAVYDFLDKAECLEMIRIARLIGFGEVAREGVRNNSRVIKTDLDLADSLWRRAEQWVVPWEESLAVGLNERFRFYRYAPGERFAPHQDGGYERLNGDESKFTFLVYLNDYFTGGETKFFDPEAFSVKPRMGSLLLFRHNQTHEGVAVESGTKYVLRSDVMYRRTDA